jgi:hypothetical protein
MNHDCHCESRFNILIEMWRKVMSEIDDLKKAVVDLTSAVNSAGAELSTLAEEVLTLSQSNPINPSDVEAAAQAIEAQATALSVAVASASVPAPTPTPVPDPVPSNPPIPDPTTTPAPTGPAVPPSTPVASTIDPATGQVTHL